MWGDVSGTKKEREKVRGKRRRKKSVKEEAGRGIDRWRLVPQQAEG